MPKCSQRKVGCTCTTPKGGITRSVANLVGGIGSAKVGRTVDSMEIGPTVWNHL